MKDKFSKDVNQIKLEIVKQLKRHDISINMNSNTFKRFLRAIIGGSKTISDVVGEIVKEKQRRMESESSISSKKSKSSKLKR